MHELDFVAGQMVGYLASKGAAAKNPLRRENLAEFGRRSARAISLIVREKEILVFSMLQWVAIAVAYYVWVQILAWIPAETWNSASKLEETWLNVAVTAWSLLCVAAAAYPIAVLTGAMGAAHFLREQGLPSTVPACLRLALPNSTRLWVFHAIDAWLTVQMILERMPKKGHFKAAAIAQRAAAEALYYAWKVGTIGVPPALLAGRSLADAGKESVALVRKRTWEVARLRGGYSAICWIIGLATYFGSLAFLVAYPSPVAGQQGVSTFYLWAGIPILIAVGMIKLLVRPVYVIASCQLYSEFLEQKGGAPVRLEGSRGWGAHAFAAFVALCVLVLLVALYRDEIGLTWILSGGS
jgi:hypothetical protein